jgi:succinate dehydrogenase/fumarate reductase flavoprotein subunit
MTVPATLDALAFLYIAFGHAPDEVLTPEEMRTLAEHLGAWVPEAEQNAVGAALKQAVAAYRKLGSPRDKLQRALESAKSLAIAVPTQQHAQILEDLQSIARADGTVSREERSLMEAVGKILASS